MNRFDNPFHDLWLTEILSPIDFVRMFSPKIVEFAEDLFGTGNVIIRGRQGSGKSMLLRLLDTKTRVAYAQAGENCPIPDNRPFISGSVNLTRSNVSSMSGRLSKSPDRKEKLWAARTFADFLNYSLASNLLQGLMSLAEAQKSDTNLIQILPVNLSEDSQLELVHRISTDSTWYGALEGCGQLSEVISRLSDRISEYLGYFNFNKDKLDPFTENSKTEIGKPISKLADSLRESRVLPNDCLVYFKNRPT